MTTRPAHARLAALLAVLAVAACTATAPPPPLPTAATSDASPAPVTASPPATPSASPSPSSSPSPSPSPTAAVPRAPASPQELALSGTVVPMAFPFAPSAGYRYAPNFLDRRLGRPLEYNHIRRVLEDGTPERAHDGVDIYVRRGTPIRAVFDGIVIDPAARWRPWDAERYGNTAVIVSTEATSPGYAALYVHLDRLLVEPGERVSRGDIIGTTGSTGNAEGTPLHLHFELRAPFLFPVRRSGVRRLMDAFDPYPSLVAADPNAEGD